MAYILIILAIMSCKFEKKDDHNHPTEKNSTVDYGPAVSSVTPVKTPTEKIAKAPIEIPSFKLMFHRKGGLVSQDTPEGPILTVDRTDGASTLILRGTKSVPEMKFKISETKALEFYGDLQKILYGVTTENVKAELAIKDEGPKIADGFTTFLTYKSNTTSFSAIVYRLDYEKERLGTNGQNVSAIHKAVEYLTDVIAYGYLGSEKKMIRVKKLAASKFYSRKEIATKYKDFEFFSFAMRKDKIVHVLKHTNMTTKETHFISVFTNPDHYNLGMTL